MFFLSLTSLTLALSFLISFGGEKHDTAAALAATGLAAPANRWHFATVGNVTVNGMSRVTGKSRKFAEFFFYLRGCGDSDQRGLRMRFSTNLGQAGKYYIPDAPLEEL